MLHITFPLDIQLSTFNVHIVHKIHACGRFRSRVRPEYSPRIDGTAACCFGRAEGRDEFGIDVDDELAEGR